MPCGLTTWQRSTSQLHKPANPFAGLATPQQGHTPQCWGAQVVQRAHMLEAAGESRASRMPSMAVARDPSFRLATAVTREASCPPCGCFRLRSCAGTSGSSAMWSCPPVMPEVHRSAHGSAATQGERVLYCLVIRWCSPQCACLYDSKGVVCKLFCVLVLPHPGVHAAVPGWTYTLQGSSAAGDVHVVKHVCELSTRCLHDTPRKIKAWVGASVCFYRLHSQDQLFTLRNTHDALRNAYIMLLTLFAFDVLQAYSSTTSAHRAAAKLLCALVCGVSTVSASFKALGYGTSKCGGEIDDDRMQSCSLCESSPHTGRPFMPFEKELEQQHVHSISVGTGS